MNFYQRQQEIALGESTKLNPPEHPEGICSSPLCNNLAVEDEEYCAECLTCQAEEQAGYLEDR